MGEHCEHGLDPYEPCTAGDEGFPLWLIGLAMLLALVEGCLQGQRKYHGK